MKKKEEEEGGKKTKQKKTLLDLLFAVILSGMTEFNKDFIYTTTKFPCRYYQTMKTNNTITQVTFEMSIFLDFY